MKTTLLFCTSCLLVMLNANCKENKLETENIEKISAGSLRKTASVLPIIPGTDTSKYPAARIFPGLVASSEPRLTNYNVALDLTYTKVATADLKISKAPDAWLSTGKYTRTRGSNWCPY